MKKLKLICKINIIMLNSDDQVYHQLLLWPTHSASKETPKTQRKLQNQLKMNSETHKENYQINSSDSQWSHKTERRNAVVHKKTPNTQRKHKERVSPLAYSKL